MSLVNVIIGEKVREYRLGANLTQSELAARLGADQGTMSNIERGRIGVSIPRLLKLAQILDCDAGDLLPMRLSNYYD